MTTTIVQLQQVGLNKYEAEAYYTLLRLGPLTGYEVGKHSQVPLSRSYEILERLVDKGLALSQPGEPVRYLARDPQQFLAQVRSSMEGTLQALTTALLALAPPAANGEFWVLRGQQHILQHCRTMIDAARTELQLILPVSYNTLLDDVLQQARARGCRVSIYPAADQKAAESVMLLCDEAGLIGTLSADEACQVLVSANVALLAALRGYFTCLHPVQQVQAQPVFSAQPAQTSDSAWVDWEAHKQEQLRRSIGRNRVA